MHQDNDIITIMIPHHLQQLIDAQIPSSLQAELITLREALHREPECSNQEYRTQELLLAALGTDLSMRKRIEGVLFQCLSIRPYMRVSVRFSMFHLVERAPVSRGGLCGAGVIIGAITDTSLDGKIRLSIGATAQGSSTRNTDATAFSKWNIGP